MRGFDVEFDGYDGVGSDVFLVRSQQFQLLSPESVDYQRDDGGDGHLQRDGDSEWLHLLRRDNLRDGQCHSFRSNCQQWRDGLPGWDFESGGFHGVRSDVCVVRS